MPTIITTANSDEAPLDFNGLVFVELTTTLEEIVDMLCGIADTVPNRIDSDDIVRAADILGQIVDRQDANLKVNVVMLFDKLRGKPQ